MLPTNGRVSNTVTHQSVIEINASNIFYEGVSRFTTTICIYWLCFQFELVPSYFCYCFSLLTNYCYLIFYPHTKYLLSFNWLVSQTQQKMMYLHHQKIVDFMISATFVLGKIGPLKKNLFRPTFQLHIFLFFCIGKF